MQFARLKSNRPVRVSLVVGLLNEQRALPALLDSILAVDIPASVSFETLLVDNGSTDDSAALIKQYCIGHGDIIKYVAQPMRGVSLARNAGIRLASGDIIAITDGDCVLAKDWLAAIVREFDADPDLALIGGRVELFDPSDLDIATRRYRERIPVSVDAGNVDCIPGCNMAFTRRAVDSIGLYDVRLGPGAPLMIAEDVDLIYRFARRGLKVVYTPDVLVFHNHGRKTAESYDATHWLYGAGKGVFFAKHILRGDRRVMKLAYWEYASLLRDLKRALGRRDRKEARKLLRGMVAILDGFRWVVMHQLRRRLRGGAVPPDEPSLA